ncbi:hypothetical protein KIN20_024043 [Parelaphostrongylus tenuis]|uniref:FYVE-type domain-containing protein n=1 Tax=Parelaphostrongylus tenuis TaxID=148309 RepID=A0AAD5MSN8_PARTN|nr:hypothetical protein KIN20_024043 [Parelaphostrongylus tenuis]
MTASGSCNEDEITFFDRLAEENIEENSANTTSVISNIIGRFWRPQIAASNETIGSSAPFYDGYATSISAADDSSKVNPSSISQESSMISLNRQENESNTSAQVSNPSTSQYWMPDSTGKECYQCEERFSTFRRRHHCRLCGQIFCSKCCNIHMPGSSLGYLGDLRLCHYCARVMAQYLPPEDDGARSPEESGPVTNDEKTRMVDTLSNMGPTISAVSGNHISWHFPLFF